MAGRIAGAASFLLVAETGTFNADITAAEAKWASTTANMSEHTLKVNAAQTRLRETLAKYPNDVQRVNRATVSLMQAQREAATATHRTTAALQAEERSFGRLERGALVGSGALRGLGRSAAFASTAFIGGAGLVFALRSSIKAAEDHQVVQGQLRVTLKDAGLAYGQYAGQIKKSDEALTKLGFTEEERYRSLNTLVRATKDVTRSEQLRNVAADISRATNKKLEVATNAVAKATAGQDTQLRRLIPGLDKGAKGYDLIADAQRRTAGQAEKYARSTAGAQDRLNAAIHETEVTIGSALLPTVTRLSTQLADWLGKSKNQKRIQDDVNQAVKVGAGVVHGLSTAVHVLAPGIKSVVGALGGVEHAMELAFGLYLLKKLGAARAGVTNLLTQIKLIGPATVASTAEADVALAGMTAAERTAAGAAPRGFGSALTRRAGQAAAAIFLYPYEKEFFKEAFGIDPGGGVSKGGSFEGRKPGDVITDTFGGRLIMGPDRKLYTPAQLAAKARERAKHDAPRDTSQVDLARAQAAGAKSGTAIPTASLPRALTDAVLRASLTSNQADDLRAAQAEESFLRANLARVKKGTKLYSDILAALVSAHGQVESIQSQINSENQRHDDALARSRKAAANKREQAARAAERAAAPAGRDARAGALFGASADYNPITGHKPTKPLTAADIRAELNAFLLNFQGVERKYGNNFGQAEMLLHLTRETNGHLRDLGSRFRYPEARGNFRASTAAMDA